METLESLLEDHAALRRRSAALESLIGPQTGAGWEDWSPCDMERFRKELDAFTEALMIHEAREERLIADGLEAAGRPELMVEVDRAHESINELVGLLHSIAVLCTGGRVHALRGATLRVRGELETHLRVEEGSLFPLLRTAAAVQSPPPTSTV